MLNYVFFKSSRLRCGTVGTTVLLSMIPRFVVFDLLSRLRVDLQYDTTGESQNPHPPRQFRPNPLRRCLDSVFNLLASTTDVRCAAAGVSSLCTVRVLKVMDS